MEIKPCPFCGEKKTLGLADQPRTERVGRPMFIAAVAAHMGRGSTQGKRRSLYLRPLLARKPAGITEPNKC